jgi:hypothetical protein
VAEAVVAMHQVVPVRAALAAGVTLVRTRMLLGSAMVLLILVVVVAFIKFLRTLATADPV